MLLANPIYDTIFKYLLEDLELARQLVAQIIGEEVIELVTQANEAATKLSKYELHVLRLDFKAVILTKNGERKKILIELQKAQQLGDIMRFRKYLGNNYLKEDSFGTAFEEPDGLPIITIYFLGFRLKKVPTPVLKVNRVYLDLMTNELLNAKEEFVEKLTHDSYIIQIPRLEQTVRNDLERVLTVFNQSYITTDRKILQLQEEDLGDNKLLEQLVGRLRRAVSDEQILLELELEEDYTRILDDAYRKARISEEKAELAEERLAKFLRESKETARLVEEAAQEKARLAEEAAQEKARLAEEAAQEKARLAEEAAQEKTRLAEEKYQALLEKVQKLEALGQQERGEEE